MADDLIDNVELKERADLFPADLRWKLVEQGHLIEGLLASISQGVLVVGADGRINAFNDRVCDLLDMPATFMQSHPTLHDMVQYQFQRGDFGRDLQRTTPDLHRYLMRSRADVSSHIEELPPNYTRTTPSGRVLEIKTQPLATAQINKDGGRDHWPQVGCALLAGGGMKTGQVIGATDRLGGEIADRGVHFGEVFATLYHQLGIDANRVTLPDLSGRPQYLVDGWLPMPELISA